MQTEIYHLFHSGTAVKVKDKLFVFDYFKDEAQNKEGLGSPLEKGIIREESLANINELYVFVSHSHNDHYNPVIFEWEKYCQKTNYILASELEPEEKYKKKSNLYLMDQDQELKIEEVQVKSFGSTDAGISFLVEYDDLSIFHAGDLNWWKWKKFSPKVQAREAREYKREVDKLIGRKVDIAFVPVDPRLEENYYLAGEYFIAHVKPDIFIPIHFGENYAITKSFKEKMDPVQSRVVKIDKPGKKIIYQK